MTTMICRLYIGNPAEKSYEYMEARTGDDILVDKFPRTKHELVAFKRELMALHPENYVGKSYHCKDGIRYEVYHFEYKVE